MGTYILREPGEFRVQATTLKPHERSISILITNPQFLSGHKLGENMATYGSPQPLRLDVVVTEAADTDTDTDTDKQIIVQVETQLSTIPDEAELKVHRLVYPSRDDQI